MFSKYYKPADLEEALSILDKYQGRARIMAGGTDLVLQLMRQDVLLDAVLDISNLTEFRYIREEGAIIKIGSLSTHSQISDSPLLKKIVPFLSDASRSVGSRQIRNVGTIGGNVVNAQPAADAAVALMALDASAKVVSSSGERLLLVGDLYRPEGGTALDPGCEILTDFFFSPLEKGKEAGAFGRFARRKAVTLPIFNSAVIIRLGDRGTIADARIVMGPVARTPFRAKKSEMALLGNYPTEKCFLEAATAAAEEANPRDSYFRGKLAYRKKLVRVMVLRTLKRAWESLKKGELHDG